MRAKNIALGIVLLLSSLVYAQGDCDLDVEKTYYQNREYAMYDFMPVPSAKVIDTDIDEWPYYVVFTDLELVEEAPWPPQLYLLITYCDSRTQQEKLKIQMYPGSYNNPGVGYPKINYYGPIPKTLCRAVESAFSSSDELFFSTGLNGRSSSFEKLLFKKVLARNRQLTTKQIVSSNSGKTLRKVVAPRLVNPLDVPDGVDINAKSACRAAVKVYTR